MRFLPVTPSAFLVELADLDATLALLASLAHEPVAGVTEVVPAARTLMLRFRPEEASAEAIAAVLLTRPLTGHRRDEGRSIEIPVVYDGDDLAECADLLGTSVEEVIRRHAGADYTVAFTGFAPGFAYLTAPEAGLAVPRRKTPRTRIPAGAVGLAGPFSGVYPRESPGGWQIIGRTPLVMFDAGRAPAALLAPGDRVRFRRLDRMPARAAAAVQPAPAGRPGLHVRGVGLPVLVQDLGRPGMAAQGVSISGALDRGALAAANRAVGNPPGAAALEITLGGLGLEAARSVTIALTGAPAPITIETADGHRIAAPHGHPIRLVPGDRVTLAAPARGMRSYLAVAGGLDVPKVMGSAATDTLASIGPPPLKAGDGLPVGRAPEAAPHAAPPGLSLPAGTDTVVLDVCLGPRTDWFTPEAVALLAAQDWTVTPESSRVGIRLAGARPLERARTEELPSEATVPGALQVPASGQPVLFLADHPLTGGYPVIGVIAPHHLDLAAQVPIGARIRLRPVAAFAEIVPAPEPLS